MLVETNKAAQVFQKECKVTAIFKDFDFQFYNNSYENVIIQANVPYLRISATRLLRYELKCQQQKYCYINKNVLQNWFTILK